MRNTQLLVLQPQVAGSLVALQYLSPIPPLVQAHRHTERRHTGTQRMASSSRSTTTHSHKHTHTHSLSSSLFRSLFLSLSSNAPLKVEKKQPKLGSLQRRRSISHAPRLLVVATARRVRGCGVLAPGSGLGGFEGTAEDLRKKDEGMRNEEEEIRKKKKKRKKATFCISIGTQHTQQGEEGC